MELDIHELLHSSPLFKTFTFNAWMVAGFTPITRGSKLDYYINRPQGMKGYIINLTQRGQARARAGTGSLLFRENDLLLFPPGVPHHYGRDENSEHWDHLWIYFIPRPYWVNWLKWDNTTYGIGKTTVMDQQQLKILQDLFYAVILEHNATAPLSEALAMNALERLILNCFQLQPIGNQHIHDPRIKVICEYLDENIAQEIKIETLASMVFLSPSRLAHLFKHEVGQTIYAWREMQRINRAKWLVQTTTLPFNKVALSVGYSDPVYFTRIFRKHNGIAPGAYRKHYSTMRG
ncbi:DNA-binding transcriptional regulator AraC [Pectobacterium actinidiae]|uniref:Arabinose operon regulatory protein n=1 Tax=Pectobacterium actinidiae TaxID=1507808 RepID=A0A1V2QYB4_9GAMM|nr:arabinose operon transcriptional regulator AraC [Pectobacterium actinidiae]KHN91393.1 arabinose operon regulatory protein [Pectobacterium actinidiae]ONK01065.1 DNA-binding transcriptional regulator AraC [Pectobacterium actinidiae]ONK01260.1 DNA-binding transcriptional regulator AraC [Pectobacterium actinidiae]WEF13568.1 arabinose operon transcriptional regulator AraC [Pectobacterium actinidiae]